MPNFVNLPAVAVCAILNMVLGALWYSVILGKPWMKLMGTKADHMNDKASMKRANQGYVISMICYVVMALVISYFVRLAGATTAIEGVRIAFLGWLGFAVTTSLPNHYFSNHKKPLPLAAINLGYPLVGMSMMGAILAVWQ